MIALVVEAVRDAYQEQNAKSPKENASSLDSINVWTYLDLRSREHRNQSDNGDVSIMKTKYTTTLAEDPPHLNFAEPDDVSAFFLIFVDLFLMSYARCVVYGAGGFGRMGVSLDFIFGLERCYRIASLILIVVYSPCYCGF